MVRLKQYRKSMGVTQMDIERLTGIKQNNYSRYESGESRMPYEVAKKLSDVLRIEWYKIVEMAEERQ